MEPIEIDSSPEEERLVPPDSANRNGFELMAADETEGDEPVAEAGSRESAEAPDAEDMQVDGDDKISEKIHSEAASASEDDDEFMDEDAETAVKVSTADRLAELSAIDALLATVPQSAAEALAALNPSVSPPAGSTRAALYAEAAQRLLDALESSTARLKRSVRALEEQEVVATRMGVTFAPLSVSQAKTSSAQEPLKGLAEVLESSASAKSLMAASPV
ncbi:hypothetical protein BCR37DRAFT_387941 [Protomyces lactucae-debilis]|uniref:Mediator of RNA polymerase II transcription subunit 11 n=1 Tax=Protomyces lactucae-debilis TaxID=2754530 RepID=A0A1Y2FBU1_PROLT|nr:uncharacterized protein BCR37DRAFT_387941 [Protomyces lactucae-debilis]ORY80904.1 hypothetical protein BCR37DRAFT_387941 [Protomyces lactucae-debilis]